MNHHDLKIILHDSIGTAWLAMYLDMAMLTSRHKVILQVRHPIPEGHDLVPLYSQPSATTLQSVSVFAI